MKQRNTWKQNKGWMLSILALLLLFAFGTVPVKAAGGGNNN
ncbi:MAG: hypothetical protein Q4D60_08985 [Eubacteriales bacterium]|nr:hypothetical protein [Eubacteriales bacterium]